MWQQRMTPPSFPVSHVAPTIIRRPAQLIQQYGQEGFYDEEEMSDFEQSESNWEQDKPQRNWRGVAVPILASLIVVVMVLGALQVTIWNKPGTNFIAVVKSTISSTTNAKATSSNATQTNSGQPNTIPYSKERIK
jgi:hypothetical protein